jgi:nucleotide-binding universal stress UspA family protein
MNKIIITSDLSEQRDQVFDLGLKLAGKLNAAVDLVTIINQNIDYMPADTGMNFNDQWEAREFQARAILEQVKINHPDSVIDIVVFVGDPKEDIIQYAIDNKACMIVLGTHGRTGLTHTLIGSTAEYIVRHSPIPVLVVPMKNYVH